MCLNACSAVGKQGLAGNVGAHIAGKKQGCVGNILHAARLQRLAAVQGSVQLLFAGIVQLVHVIIHHIADDHAGADSVHPDVRRGTDLLQK